MTGRLSLSYHTVSLCVSVLTMASANAPEVYWEENLTLVECNEYLLTNNTMYHDVVFKIVFRHSDK